MSWRIALPGWGVRGEIFQPLQQALPHAGWQAWEWSQTQPEAQIEDWAGRLPATDGVLYAWSLSGVLALDLARHPQVRALVLLASSPCWSATTDWPGMAAARWQAFRTQLVHAPQSAAREFLALQAHGDVAAARLRRRLQPLQWPQQQAPELLDALLWDRRAALAELSLPILVVLAAADALLPVAQAPFLRRLGLKVIVLPGSHLLPWSPQLAPALAEWEARHGLA